MCIPRWITRPSERRDTLHECTKKINSRWNGGMIGLRCQKYPLEMTYSRAWNSTVRKYSRELRWDLIFECFYVISVAWRLACSLNKFSNSTGYMLIQDIVSLKSFKFPLLSSIWIGPDIHNHMSDWRTSQLISNVFMSWPLLQKNHQCKCTWEPSALLLHLSFIMS